MGWLYSSRQGSDCSLEFLRNLSPVGVASGRRKAVRVDSEDEIFESFDASMVFHKASDGKIGRFCNAVWVVEFTFQRRCVNTQRTKCSS